MSIIRSNNTSNYWKIEYCENFVGLGCWVELLNIKISGTNYAKTSKIFLLYLWLIQFSKYERVIGFNFTGNCPVFIVVFFADTNVFEVCILDNTRKHENHCSWSESKVGAWILGGTIQALNSSANLKNFFVLSKTFAI